MAADDSFNTQSLLESVIGLTEHRDQQSLERCLLETMCELTAASRVALYTAIDSECATLTLAQSAQARGQASPRGESSSRISSAIALQNAAQAFRQCLESGSGQGVVDFPYQMDGGVSISYPVIGAGEKLAGVLTVEYPTLSAADHRMIGAFLRIYQNYQTLLNESQRDRLTNLLNRKTFDDHVNRILAELRSSHQRAGDFGVYCLAILDIDHFKRINDTFGHLYGDEVLLLFSRIMKQTFRSEDLLFRFGGEEFVVLLKTPSLDSCMRTLERFRSNVEGYHFPQVGQVTVSGGCVGITGSGLPTTLIDHADQALYYAKNHGRNQVHLYEHLVAEGKLIPVTQEGSVDLF